MKTLLSVAVTSFDYNPSDASPNATPMTGLMFNYILDGEGDDCVALVKVFDRDGNCITTLPADSYLAAAKAIEKIHEG